jgi:hypothetical protein
VTTTKLGIFPRAADQRTDVNGFAFGLVADRTPRLTGLQLAIGYTLTDERMSGVQMAAGATITRGEARGLQLAGGAAVADGSFRGLQMAGAINGARNMRGLQMAGGVNVADSMAGLQMAPVNLARSQRGVQLGVVNVTDEGAGFRMGVVNVADRARGFQFGVVNVARHDDGESFALLSIIGDGIHAVTAFATDVMLTNLAFKLGGRHLYTAIGAGYQPGDGLAGTGPDHFVRGTGRWGSSLGIGWRFPVDAGRLENLELEANGTNIHETWTAKGTAPMLNSLRLQANVRLAPHIALLAGVAANVVVGLDGTDLDLSLGGPQGVFHGGATTVRIYPGFLLGLQI